MLNTGINPTIGNKGRTTEVHIFDFNERLYDKEIRVCFLQKLREERKFSSVEELKIQLGQDKEVSLKLAKKFG
jgi:riboflavin kinase/FMN adenylyltransferase